MHSLSLAFASLFFVVPPVGAGTIDFEDLPAANDSSQTLTEEYADRGVHFSSTDDGATWSGLSGGDPGGWQVDGSNGPTFVGFDGGSYIAVVNFDEPVQGLQLDVSRAAGIDAPNDFVMLVGYLGDTVVDVAQLHLGDVNLWTTVSMSLDVDRLVVQGVGLQGYRFGVDNFRWVGDESDEPIALDVDIQPGSDVNRVRVNSQGVMTVAVYGAEEFDVMDLDPDTLVFGPDEMERAHRNGPHFDDLDEDGFLDMLLHFHTASTGIGSDDVEACLMGETWDGLAAIGCDAVNPIH